MFGRKKKQWSREFHLIDQSAPFNYIEAFKSLRTTIDFMAAKQSCKTIVVTSAEPEDGKSTVALNLTKAIAESGHKVILVDGDLRKGTIARYLNIQRSTPGLAHVLAKQKELTDVILYNATLGADILTTGALLPNASESVASSGMMSVLEELSENYDYIIIDTPPVTVVTDAAVFSRITDGVLMVVRAKKTTKQSLIQSKKILDDVDANVLGCIMNDYESGKWSYGKGKYYYSSYEKNHNG